MTVPFGFSTGDFVAVASLVWKICQALREASGDAKIFGNLLTELVAFNDVVVRLQNSVGSLLSMPQDQRSALETTLHQAKTTIEDFSFYVDAFKASSANGAKTQSIANWRKRVSWSLSGVKKIKGFRESMQSYSAILNLALLSLNTHAVQKLDQRVGEEAKSLSLQIQQHAVDINSQITSSLEDPWEQKPIRFQDAMGRRYPVPLEVCRTLVGLLDFFSHAFKDTPMDTAIEQLSIWLFTPILGKPNHWNLITAEDWETCARPGMQLGMSLATASIDDGSGPKGAFSFKTQAKIAFHTPLPPWAPYSEDAEFEYLPYEMTPRRVDFRPLATTGRQSRASLARVSCCRCLAKIPETFGLTIPPAKRPRYEYSEHPTHTSTIPKSHMQLEFEPNPPPVPHHSSDPPDGPSYQPKEEVETWQLSLCILCGKVSRVHGTESSTPFCSSCKRQRFEGFANFPFPLLSSTPSSVTATEAESVTSNDGDLLTSSPD